MRANVSCPIKVVNNVATKMSSAVTATGLHIAESLLKRQIEAGVITDDQAFAYARMANTDLHEIIDPIDRLRTEYGRLRFLRVSLRFFTHLIKCYPPRVMILPSKCTKIYNSRAPKFSSRDFLA